MKENSKIKATFFSMFMAIFNSLVLMVLNLVYGKLIIVHYSSYVNGLISTLSNFVSMFSIVEGGVTVAAVVASYDPIVKKDYNELNNILYTISVFLRKIAFIFMLLTGTIGCIYLRYINSPLNGTDTIAMLFITIAMSSITFLLVSKYTIVLSGYNRGYIVSALSSLSKTICWIISIILIVRSANILIVYAMNLGNVILNFLLLYWYEKRNFPHVTYKGNYNAGLIKGTKDVFFQKIASTIFNSTDLVLISIGINLAMSSVYNIYAQIFHTINTFLVSIIEAPSNSFGHLLREGDMNKAYNLFFIFQKIITMASTIILSAVGMSIISFLNIYTKGINDANYIIPSLVGLFFSYYFFKLNNSPFGQLINVSGRFKLQNSQCAVAVIVNLLLSVGLIKTYGVQGVVFGSVVGTLVILVANIYQCCYKIIGCEIGKTALNIIVNYGIGILLIIFSIRFQLLADNYFSWILQGIINVIISTLFVVGTNFVISYNDTLYAVKYIIGILLKFMHIR